VKRLFDLTPADIRRCAVWRYEGETDEVALLHATDKRELDADERDIFIAETHFVLANGTQHIGFCTPAAEDSALDYLQPAIVTGAGHVYFWFNQPPSREMLQAQWKLLEVGHEEIFPVHFRCAVPVGGRFITGMIEAEDLTGPA
jgi:hypothetical protein